MKTIKCPKCQRIRKTKAIYGHTSCTCGIGINISKNEIEQEDD